jgi:hypothetical protein
MRVVTESTVPARRGATVSTRSRRRGRRAGAGDPGSRSRCRRSSAPAPRCAVDRNGRGRCEID